MPTSDRRPRPRRARTGFSFSTEREVREAVAKVRQMAEPERLDAWQTLRPAVARWVSLKAGRSVRDDQWPGKVADIYLRRPELLPLLGPKADRGAPSGATRSLG